MNQTETMAFATQSENPTQRIACSHGQFLRVLAIAMLVGLTLVTSIVTWGEWAVWMPDSFWYLDCARRLAETGTLLPERFLRPPGFSLMLAPLVAMEGELPLRGVKMLMSACLAATVAVTYRLNRQVMAPRYAWLAAACVAVCPALLRLSHSILTEIPFTLFSCAALLLCGRWRETGLRHGREALVAGLLVLAAAWTRTIGLTLLPIALICAWRYTPGPRRDKLRHGAIVAVVCFASVVVWQIRQSAYPVTPSYFDALIGDSHIVPSPSEATAAFLARLGRYGLVRLCSLKELFLSPVIFWRLFQTPLALPTSLLIGGLLAGVVCHRFRRLNHPMDAYVLMSLAVLAVWPYDEGVRMVAPLAPIVLATPFWVLTKLESQRARPRVVRIGLRMGTAVWLLAMTIGSVNWFMKLDTLRQKSDHTQSRMADLADWQRRAVPADQTILALVPRGAEEKLLLLGAAYQSRQRMAFVDVRGEQNPVVAWQDYDAAVVHETLAQEAQIGWRAEAIDRRGRLLLFRNPRSVITAGRGDCFPRPTSPRFASGRDP